MNFSNLGTRSRAEVGTLNEMTAFAADADLVIHKMNRAAPFRFSEVDVKDVVLHGEFNPITVVYVKQASS